MSKRTAAILFFSFLFLYLLTMGGHLYSPDEEILFLTTKALAENGSLAIEPPEAMQGFATKRGIDGRQYGQYGVGQPLLAIPFYYLGSFLADRMGDRPIGLRGIQHLETTAREDWERFGVSLFNQVVAALLVVLLFALAWDLTGDRTSAILTAVLYGAGTIAWVHSKPFFTETLASVCIFSAFALLVRARLYNRPGWNMLAGLAAGYAVLVRLDSIVAYPALAVLVVWPDEPPVEVSLPVGGDGRYPKGSSISRFLGERLRDRAIWDRVGQFAPPVVLAGLIVLGLNWMRFGSLFSTGYGDQPEGVAFVNPLLVGLYGFLFSLGKGVFFFSPPLVLFFWSIRRFIRQAPPAGWAVVVLAVSLLLFHSKWINWAGGWCWGPRHLFMIHVFLALPICALLSAPRRPTLVFVFGALLAAGVSVQLYGTSQNFIDYYHVSFQNPYVEPTARVVYNPGEDAPTVLPYFRIEKQQPHPPRVWEKVPPWDLTAPIGDSIWRFRNSPWGKYREMWELGYHDYFWLEQLGRPSRAHAVKDWMRKWIEELEGETEKK